MRRHLANAAFSASPEGALLPAVYVAIFTTKSGVFLHQSRAWLSICRSIQKNPADPKKISRNRRECDPRAENARSSANHPKLDIAVAQHLFQSDLDNVISFQQFKKENREFPFTKFFLNSKSSANRLERSIWRQIDRWRSPHRSGDRLAQRTPVWGHEATDTWLPNAPVSQATGHCHATCVGGRVCPVLRAPAAGRGCPTHGRWWSMWAG